MSYFVCFLGSESQKGVELETKWLRKHVMSFGPPDAAGDAAGDAVDDAAGDGAGVPLPPGGCIIYE